MTADLVARGARLASRGRAIVGLAGIPGAGKSTLARGLVDGLVAAGTPAAYLPMDGFHLPARELEERGLVSLKGAPATFDAAGFATLLARVAAGDEVLAPDYDRTVHDVVPGRLGVPAAARVVVTEGNYLGLDAGPWAAVRPLLTELWFLDVPWSIARERLIARRVATGRREQDAIAWVDSVDAANARVVEATRAAADLVIPA